MKSGIVLAALVLIGLSLAGDAAAQHVVDPKTAKKLNAVLELIQQDQLDKALEVLGTFNTEKLKEYPAAMVHQMSGFIYANQDHYDEAIASYEQALALNALPEGSQLKNLFILGQLYMRTERYDRAIDTFERWFREGRNAKEPIEPNASAYYQLAVAYFQAERPDEALAPAQQAVDMTDEPREGWINLLLAIRMGRKEYKEALPLLEMLVARFPRKGYYLQLAAVYAELDSDKKSLAVQQLAYMQGLLDTHRELTRLAQLYLFNDLPYRGALVLEKGLGEGKIESESKTWRLLGNAWLQAREYDRALAPLEKAAELAEDGEAYLRVAQVRVQREEWQEAIDALQKSLEKGGLPVPGQAYLLIGVARYNQKKLGLARAAFVQARNDEKARKLADTWIKHLDREQQSQAQPG